MKDWFNTTTKPRPSNDFKNDPFDDFEFGLKCIFVGDEETGKRTLFNRFAGLELDDDTRDTEYCIIQRTVSMKKPVKIIVWKAEDPQNSGHVRVDITEVFPLFVTV